MPTPHRHFKEEIQLWLDGRLDASTCAEVQRHLETCAECRRELDALNWTKHLAARPANAVAAPEELRAKILRSLRAEAAPPAAEVKIKSARAPFWKINFRPALAWSSAVGLLAVLGALYFSRSPEILAAVGDNFRDYKNQKLALELPTGDVREMENFFAAHGVAGPTRVFDLGMMKYQLIGGRVEKFHHQPAALFVYRGADNQILHCRMYPGVAAELPAGATLRENHGIQFRVYQRGGVTMVFWPEGKIICALSSDIAAEDVVQLAFAKAMLPAKL
jgi:mycothiol system anti-sigma-R factor